jgi:hypothetical protein
MQLLQLKLNVFKSLAFTTITALGVCVCSANSQEHRMDQQERFELISVDLDMTKIIPKPEGDNEFIFELEKANNQFLRISQDIGLHSINAGEMNIALIKPIPIAVNLKHLQFLSLSKNNIGSKGSKNLSKLSLHNLEDLIISENKLGNEGLEHLTKMICKNMHILDLSKNFISKVDAILRFYTNSLNHILISGNPCFNQLELLKIIMNEYSLKYTDGYMGPSPLLLILNPGQNIISPSIEDVEKAKMKSFLKDKGITWSYFVTGRAKVCLPIFYKLKVENL